MKKTINLFILILSCSMLSAQPQIRVAEQDNEIRGSSFLPLSLNNRWVLETDNAYENSGFPQVISWHLGQIVKITDPQYNINNHTAYKITPAEGENSEVYFIEHDGFICSYQPDIDGKYFIERLVPINPFLGDIWISKGLQYTVVEVDANFLKIQFSNEILLDMTAPSNEVKSGYVIYAHGFGFYELFYYNATDNQQHFATYIINQQGSDVARRTTPRVDQNDSNNQSSSSSSSTRSSSSSSSSSSVSRSSSSSSSSSSVSRSSSSSSSSSITTANNNPAETTDIRTITRLTQGKSYIQLGAFRNMANAANLLDNARSRGFEVVAWRDTDGMIKILIETTPDRARAMLDRAKNAISSGAFLRQMR